MTESEALIALNLIPDIGSVRLKNLLEVFGSAPKIFLSSESALQKIDNIGAKIAKNIASFAFEGLKKELDLSKRLGIEIITLLDKEYPENLRNIYDPPLCLYVKGKLVSEDRLSLAIVGSRRASYYGLSCSEKFSSLLASLGITIVSGLARGIDTKAHQGALKVKGRTVAVLGSGLNCIYPPENKKLADEISESGALISEFPIDCKPLGRNFPRRNRLISGLSLGVLVVEAARNSGAMITCDFALEQGRSVFSVPGSVDSATSSGTNSLIKQGAKLVDSVEDILEELKPELSILNTQMRHRDGAVHLNKEKSVTSGKEQNFLVINEDERRIYDVLSDQPCYIDEISEKAGLAISKVTSVLSKLEIQKAVKQFPGKRFARASAANA